MSATSSGPLPPPPAPAPAPRPTWRGWRQALEVVCHPPNLGRTLAIAVVVGSVLFAINQLQVVMQHGLDGATAVRTGLNFLVPFCVSNYGLLVASHRSG